VRPESVYAVVAEAPILANAVHPGARAAIIEYPLTPTLSVDAVQVNPICVPEAAAARFAGAVGGIVSFVFADAVFEKPLRLLAASVAWTS